MRKMILAALVSAMCVIGFAQDNGDPSRKTEITVNETILVPGKELPPGKYVLKLLNATANRHVVQIFNEDQSQLQTTILAFPNERVQQTSETVLTYWETPAGSPRALRAWFAPGDNYGQEFAYPREQAERLARSNNAQIPSYQGELKPEDAATIAVANEPSPSSTSTTSAAATSRTPGTQVEAPVNTAATQSDTTRSAGGPTSATSPADAARSNAAVGAIANRDDETRAPGAVAATVPNPGTSTTIAQADNTADRTADRTATSDVLLAQNTPPATTQNPGAGGNAAQLPRTASYGPALLLIAAVAFGCASLLRFARA